MLSPLTSIPPQIGCAQDYEQLAHDFIARPVREHIAGGSGDDLTLAANRNAFRTWAVCPRPLRDVTAGHTRITLLERELRHPIMLAPVALQRLVHPSAEIETARAAGATDTCMIASTRSSCTLEDIARACGPTKWFQLYRQPERSATLDLMRRAEAAGYQAIMLTVDATLQIPSKRTVRAGFQMPADCVAANLVGYRADAPVVLEPGQSRIFQGAMREAPTWSELDWLLENTSLPLWVKGVLHPDDARQLQSRGVAGLVVSNHGGRALDGSPASLSVLPTIRAAVGSAFPLLFDSGIRSGTDVFKALALGANAVLVGRLQAYALSVAGALGVAHMIRLLREELEACMAMAGCATVAEIDAACLQAVRAEFLLNRESDADLY
ncbi:alpha-hydroxy acid oxidase [Steroidobacter sp.]|uniref:alpha-hydroxy acid oxidase n=1 Tax=Steroidobacter sp. TaxID=1978227 RepID=UPI001A4C9851|nr:alpha-hydroxy acid oxidase [Steroidobacter sp.]MBL8267877.1 alpha-hydroxy-acid oxidizing protein [Steroidobacter sp.]